MNLYEILANCVDSCMGSRGAMGLTFTKLFSRLFAKKEMRILMVGLDAAGKTTILYKLKLGEIVTTIPTIGDASFLSFCVPLIFFLVLNHNFCIMYVSSYFLSYLLVCI